MSAAASGVLAVAVLSGVCVKVTVHANRNSGGAVQSVVGILSNKINKDNLNPGDHIYSWRRSYLYAHHGIYAGNGNLIHYTRGGGQEIWTGTAFDRFIFSSPSSNSSESPCPRCGDQSKSSGVISSCLECFLSDGELYRFEYGVSPAFFLAKARGGTCTLAHSDPTQDVLRRAEHLLQNGFGAYDLFKNNCEDFAIYCKTGLLVITSVSVGRSGQVASYVAAASAIVSPSLALMGCGIYYARRFLLDIGIRKDARKIPIQRFIDRSRLNGPEVAETLATQEE